jgi:ribonuclease HI
VLGCCEFFPVHFQLISVVLWTKNNKTIEKLLIKNPKESGQESVFFSSTLPPHLQALYDEFRQTGLVGCDLDAMNKIPNSALLDVDIEDGGADPSVDTSDFQVYTDGSKRNEPHQWGMGAGYVFMRGREVIHESWPTLCHTKTVFQAEVLAITACLLALPHLVTSGKIPPYASISIFSDSQSALRSLVSLYVSSKTVLECLQTIRTTSTFHSLRLAWVKAHAGTVGNELADALAKMGASTPRPVYGPGPFHTVPTSLPALGGPMEP